MNTTNYIFTFLMIVYGVMSPLFVYGAKIDFDQSLLRAAPGSVIRVPVYLDTEGSIDNAVEVQLVYPEGLLRFVKSDDSNSIVTAWIDRPSSNGNSITASGIMSGGFNGVYDPSVADSSKKGILFTLVFQIISEGSGIIYFSDASVLKNDGVGTPDFVSTASLGIESKNSFPLIQEVTTGDSVPPELFKPMIMRDESIGNGKYFVVFETTDTGSGIDHYEIKEGSDLWRVVENPHILSDQSLRSTVLLKAVDNSNNERIVPLRTRNSWPYLPIVITIACISLLLIWKSRKK